MTGFGLGYDLGLRQHMKCICTYMYAGSYDIHTVPICLGGKEPAKEKSTSNMSELEALTMKPNTSSVGYTVVCLLERRKNIEVWYEFIAITDTSAQSTEMIFKLPMILLRLIT